MHGPWLVGPAGPSRPDLPVTTGPPPAAGLSRSPAANISSNRSAPNAWRTWATSSADLHPAPRVSARRRLPPTRKAAHTRHGRLLPEAPSRPRRNDKARATDAHGRQPRRSPVVDANATGPAGINLGKVTAEPGTGALRSRLPELDRRGEIGYPEAAAGRRPSWPNWRSHGKPRDRARQPRG